MRTAFERVDERAQLTLEAFSLLRVIDGAFRDYPMNGPQLLVLALVHKWLKDAESLNAELPDHIKL